jgi:hypothetical protein
MGRTMCVLAPVWLEVPYDLVCSTGQSRLSASYVLFCERWGRLRSRSVGGWALIGAAVAAVAGAAAADRHAGGVAQHQRHSASRVTARVRAVFTGPKARHCAQGEHIWIANATPDSDPLRAGSPGKHRGGPRARLYGQGGCWGSPGRAGRLVRLRTGRKHDAGL